MKAGRRGTNLQRWFVRWPGLLELESEDLKRVPDDVLLVDVAGCVGAQAGGFRKECPYLPGRCICQDLPITLEHLKEPPADVEMMSYDFFGLQSVKGAYHSQVSGVQSDSSC